MLEEKLDISAISTEPLGISIWWDGNWLFNHSFEPCPALQDEVVGEAKDVK